MRLNDDDVIGTGYFAEPILESEMIFGPMDDVYIYRLEK